MRKLFDGIEVLNLADALNAFRAVQASTAWRNVVDDLWGEQWGIERVLGFSTALRVGGDTVVHAFLHLVPSEDEKPATIISVAGALGTEISATGTPRQHEKSRTTPLIERPARY